MGAGSIGCYVGGRLVSAGTAEVTFVGRPALREVLTRRGLTWRQDGHEHRIPGNQIRFATEPSALTDCDVVLVCVKSGATAEVAASLRPVLAPEAVVVSFQNGVRNPEILRAILTDHPVVAGIVNFNVVVHDESIFQQSTDGALIVEATDAMSTPRWIEALRAAGLDVREVDAIGPEQWTKLLVNLNNAVSALSGAPTREMVLSRGYRRVIAMLLDEALIVLRAAGVPTARFRGVPLRVMSFVMKLPTPLARVVIRAQLKIDPESRASMWQDLERGRKTEVEFLNGEIVRLAEAHSIDAPLNRRAVELVKEAERAGKGSPELEADELLTALTRPIPSPESTES